MHEFANVKNQKPRHILNIGRHLPSKIKCKGEWKMQIHESVELQKKWGDKPCDHPSIDREYFYAVPTGDLVCRQCGMDGPTLSWFRENPKLS